MAYVESPKNWPGCVMQEDVWLSWGRLVREWVTNPGSRPSTLQEFQTQLKDNKIPMAIPQYAEQIEFVPYKRTVVYVPLPSKEMIIRGETWMKEIAQKGDGKGKYPLPSFYELAFDCHQADLTLEELQDFNLRRIGEYTINLCG